MTRREVYTKAITDYLAKRKKASSPLVAVKAHTRKKHGA